MGSSSGDNDRSEATDSASPADGLTLSQIELVDRIGWLINLRWLAFVSVTATVLIARALFQPSLPWSKLLLTALAIPVYNFVCYIDWRRGRHLGGEQIERISSRSANVQILCDLLVLGALIHFSGGVENPFGFYFVFHMVIASILLSKRAAFAQATVALCIFSAVAAAEYYELLPHYNSPVGVSVSNLHSNGVFVFAAIWVMATSLYLTVYLATSITARLRQRTRQVVSLTHELRKNAEKLQAAYDDLAEIEQAKSAYARKVAHELRSPLAAIDNLLRVVADGLRGETSEEVRETIMRARCRTQGLLAMAGDLLALAASREGRDTSELTEIDLRQTVENVVGLLAPLAEDRRITVKTEICADLPALQGDQEGMEEVLTNLVRNAIKYSFDGGVVELRVSWGTACVEIEVSDSGIGIADEDKDRIFDEFYRARNARDLVHDGTGLGLSIVRSVVEAHGGTICLNSDHGAGARFCVRIPTRPPPGSLSPGGEAPPSSLSPGGEAPPDSLSPGGRGLG